MNIEEKIDYIITTIKNTHVNFDVLLAAFESGDIFTINTIRSKLNHDQYISFLSLLLEKIENFMSEKDKVSVYIKAFQTMFFLFKAGDLKTMKSFHSNFISLCLIYDELYLGCKHNFILRRWDKEIQSIFPYSYEKLKPFFQYSFLDFGDLWHGFVFPNYSPESFDPHSIFSSIIKESYTLVRSDPKQISNVYILIDKIVYFFLENQFDSTLYNRIISLIALKNDISLQQELTLDQIHLYVLETKYIFENNLFYGGRETGLKLLEMIGKAQFAYNLIGANINIKQLFARALEKVREEYFISPLNEDEFITDQYQMGMAYFYYVLFKQPLESVLRNDYYRLMYEAIVHQWSQRKYEYYYGSKLPRQDIEISYNFIY